MANRDKLIEIVKESLMRNIGKSCNLAENIVDDIISKGAEIKMIGENNNRLFCNDIDELIDGDFESLPKLSEKEFIRKFCSECGTQRCEGPGTDWFEGCRLKNLLEDGDNKND